MIELGKETERVILVGVSLTEQEDTRKSLDELKDLASTAGAETVGTLPGCSRWARNLQVRTSTLSR